MIKTNQVDPVTGQRRTVTKAAVVQPDLSFKNGLQFISFTTINDKIFIVLHGEEQDAGTVLQDDISLLITGKDTLTVRSAGTQISYGKEDARHYYHQYLISIKDLDRLAHSPLLLIRRFSSTGIFESLVAEKFRPRVMELCNSLLKEMKNK